MKIGIICSPGGHLTQAVSALKAFEGQDCFLMVQDFPACRNMSVDGVRKIYSLKVFFDYSWHLGFPMSLIWDTAVILKILIQERPEVLFSTGAEIAIPAFYLAKTFLRMKLIFLESLTRIGSPSKTGKWIYPIADLFLVQDKSLLPLYGSKAVYRGCLL